MSAPNPRKPRFPLWQYLNQPLFDQNVKLILHPKRFWHEHQIGHLKRCWQKESTQKGKPHP